MSADTPTDSKRYAGDIAPEPCGDIPTVGAALAMLRAHAARAQGLWLAMIGHDHASDGTWAVVPMLTEWRLARVWYALATDRGPQDPDALAASVASAAVEPQCIGPEIYAMCRSAGIDPDSVRPYSERDVFPTRRQSRQTANITKVSTR